MGFNGRGVGTLEDTLTNMICEYRTHSITTGEVQVAEHILHPSSTSHGSLITGATMTYEFTGTVLSMFVVLMVAP